MFSASKSGQISKGLPDPQFNYVTALLHGDGTNGAQNNTFLDSSTNNATITRTGTPTQGSFSPYGSLWSNYFNGTTDYLITNNTTNLGSGNFTIEGWFYFNGFGSNQVLIDVYNGSTTNSWQIYTNTGAHFFWYSAATGITQIVGTATLSINTWYHFAAVRSGTTVKTYVNGVLDGTTTDATNYNATGALWIGGQRVSGPTALLNGYASNVRIVVGTAVYTSTFTPPTSPLTAITGTQLLTCQANRFIDNSGNSYVITPTGTPSVQRYNSFLPTSSQAYSTSVYGGSAYFNGSTDYLTAPSSSSYAFGTTGTIEAWVYLTAYNINQRICDINSGGSTLDAYITTSGFIGAYGGIFTTTTGAIALNTWAHVAIVLTSGVPKVYVNGVSQTLTGTTSGINISSTGTLYIANYYLSTTYIFSGYMEDFRVTNTAVYSANFTPPTAPLTAISGTVILLNYVNAGIYDNAMMNDLITVGSAQISTSVKKYGSGSLSFNGSTGYLQSQTGQNFIFYTGNWTIECWFYITSSVNYQTIYAVSDDQSTGTNEISARFDGSNNMLFYVYANGSYVVNGGAGTSSALSLNTWYHHALVRNGTNISCYLNGVNTSSTTISSSITINGQTMNCIVGSNVPSLLRFFNGYIDDFRITKGYARYTSNFTPPTQALPNYGM